MGLVRGKERRLSDAYRFKGFSPQDKKVRGIFGEPQARILPMKRRSKKTRCGECGTAHREWYDRRFKLVRDLSCADTHIYLEIEFRRVLCRKCGKVKSESINWLAKNQRYTKRFATYVGKRCRDASIKSVAKELNLDWHTVKELDKEYMSGQLAKAGTPGPQAIGIDEISIRKGHTYRIVVSDLIRGCPIWFGGEDRTEASMQQFYDWLGEKKSKRIRLAVMDMWKPFRNVTQTRAPQAAILFDKFHSVPCQGTQAPWVPNPTRQLSLQPEAPRASQEVTNDLKHFGKTILKGMKRAMQAAT